MGVGNYDCTATDKIDVIFELIQKRYRKSCILPYCRQNCSICLLLFLIEYFHSVFFKLFSSKISVKRISCINL